MIRYYYNLDRYVTYSWPLGNENHFAVTDIPGMIVDAHVADGYFVHDFEIIDDYVFFCGQNATMCGFLGWFNINDLFYGGDRVYIDETLNLYGIESLDNIEVHYDKFGKIHIAGVGEHIASGISAGFKAFEASGYPLTGMQYRVADLESWDENPTLVVTDDYVVYASAVKNIPGNQGIGINLEPFPKHDMFALPTHPRYFFQTIALTPYYYYPYPPNPPIMIPNHCDPYGNKIKAVHKKGNEIAVCNYRSGIIPDNPPHFYVSDNNFSMVIREFDLSPLLSGNPIQMTSDSRIPLPLGVSDLKEFRFDKLRMHYVVLFNHSISPLIMQDAILTADYSSGTPPSMVQATYQQAYTNWVSWSLCLNGSSRYTASGWDGVNLNYYFWQDDVVSTHGNCAMDILYSAYGGFPEIDKEDVVLSKVVGWIALNFIPNRNVDIYSDINVIICN